MVVRFITVLALGWQSAAAGSSSSLMTAADRAKVQRLKVLERSTQKKLKHLSSQILEHQQRGERRTTTNSLIAERVSEIEANWAYAEGIGTYFTFDATTNTIGCCKTLGSGADYSLQVSFAGSDSMFGYGNVIVGQMHDAKQASNGFVAGQSNVIAGNYPVCAGGTQNQCGRQSEKGKFATVAGGNSNKAKGLSSLVLGGWNNEAMGKYATVAGGSSNQVVHVNLGSTVLGGQYVCTNADYAVEFAMTQTNNCQKQQQQQSGGSSAEEEDEEGEEEDHDGEDEGDGGVKMTSGLTRKSFR